MPIAPSGYLNICSLRRFLLFSTAACLVLLTLSYFWSSRPNDSIGNVFERSFSETHITNKTNKIELPECSSESVRTVGAIDVDQTAATWDFIRTKFINSTGTSPTDQSHPATAYALWSPVECQPKQKVALLIPFRDRDEHLRIFLNHMHSFLRHQQIMYTIFVIEQVGNSQFNRAALFNVGFNEAVKLDNYDCFIFHDVDLLPQDDRLPYLCQNQPTHLSVAINKFSYKLPYNNLFGGAVALSRVQFERIRGFSNCFFGWGGEDDDLSFRVRHYGYSIYRHPHHVSRFFMIKHGEDKSNKPNPLRNALLKRSAVRLKHDGYPETRYNVIFSGPAYDGLFYLLSIEVNRNQTYPEFNQMCQ